MKQLLIFLLLIPSLAYSQKNEAEFCIKNPTHWKCQSLPVELLYFKGIQENDSVKLYWSTTSEYNCGHFIVEGSDDTEVWNTVDVVYSKYHTTSQQQYYNLHVKRYNYYQLVQVDLDQKKIYYSIIYVKFKENKSNKSIKIDTSGRRIQ
jgi:hypothetical protein